MKNIIFGIILIVLGASGEFALRGTNSPALLIIVGIFLTILGFVKVLGGNMSEPDSVPAELSERQKMFAICKSCEHKIADMKTGISCGLTNSKPNFTESCSNFSMAK